MTSGGAQKSFRGTSGGGTHSGRGGAHSGAHYGEKPMSTKDTPIFETSKTKIQKYEYWQVDEVETEMLDSRWRNFVFLYKFDVNTKTDLEPCSRCFAKLIL